MHKYLFILACCFFCLEEANAMRIVPFVHSFAPNKNESTIHYFVTNNSNETVAFEISILKRGQDANGNDILEPDGSFIVFPQQIIVPSHKSRTIKVQWKGNDAFQKNPNKEQAFRVLFDQFHVNSKSEKSKKKKASLEIKLRVLASLYMVPEGTRKDIAVVSVKEILNNQGKTYLVKVKNKGTAHCSTDDINAEITVFGKQCRVCDVIDKNDKSTTILAEAEREFIITEESVKAGLQNKK